MKTKTFAELIRRMDSVISECQQFHDRNGSGKDALSLSIKSFNDAVDDARALLSKCDKIVTTDMYHIIGMGNLSASQASSFVKKVKSIGKYRYDLKWYAGSNKLSVYKYSSSSEYTPSVMDEPLKASH